MLELLQYGFLQRALVAGLAVALIAPVIGTFLVSRRYALIADALSHVAFLGVALGMLIGLEPILGALLTTILGAIVIDILRRYRAASSDALLALILSGSLAAAILIMSIKPNQSLSLQSALFGSIATVSSTDLTVILSLGAIVLIVVWLLRRPLFALALDEDLAEASGVRARMAGTILTILTAITVSLGMRVVGALLTGALMIIPVLAAQQLAKSFRQVLFLSIGAALISVVIGLAVSFPLNLPSGGTIVLTSLGLFAGAFVLRQK